MPFQISYDAELEIIVSTFTGTITMTLVKEYITALLPVLEKTGCRKVLSDSRNTELQLSSMDIVQFPKMAQASPLTENLKRATVASPGTSGYELYESLCKVQGQNVQLFNSLEKARDWLTK